jgi:hypothetical protein
MYVETWYISMHRHFGYSNEYPNYQYRKMCRKAVSGFLVLKMPKPFRYSFEYLANFGCFWKQKNHDNGCTCGLVFMGVPTFYHYSDHSRLVQ